MTPNRWFACLATALSVLLIAAFISTTTRVVAADSEPRGAPVKAAKAKAARQAPAAPAPGQPAAGYVGEDTCLTCHADQAYKGTKHGVSFNERTPAATHGCESCHGPGQKHVDTGDPALIRNFKTMRPGEASEICTTCHKASTHALWDGSQHDQRNLGCTTCHSVHSPKGEPQLTAANQVALCSKCHRAIVNKTYRHNHMPVREGALQCASCHNPHGSTNVRLLKVGTTVDESCTSCHADKRGPYLWEHAPVTESCVTCHDPHGTNNDRMLVSKLPFLCQRCHVTSRHPPTVYEGYLLNNSQNANKIYGRGCTVCHQMVHGSNSPSGKTLLR